MPTRPARWWLHPQVIVMVLVVAVTCAALYGVLEAAAFNSPSGLKYALTVLGPALLGLLVGRRQAPLLLGVVMILAAPFALATTIANIQVAPVSVFLIAAALAVRWQQPVIDARVGSPIGRAGLIMALCLAVPVVDGIQRGLYLQLLLTGLLSGYVCCQLARERDNRRLLLLAFVASASLQAALACYEFGSGHRLNFYGASGGASFGTDYFFAYDNINRASAAMPDPIALGNVLALACPITLVLIFQFRSPLLRLGLAGCGALMIVGLVSTLSRMSWIGAGAGVLVALLLMPGKQRLAAVLGLVATVAAALGAAVGLGGSAVTSRFDSIADPTASQVSTSAGDIARLELQHTALRVAEHHPLVGVGFGNLTPYLIASVPGVTKGTHAHNTYYNVLAEAGLLGGLAIAAVLLGAVLAAWRSFRTDRLAVAGLAGAVVALALVWTTDYTIRNVQVMAMVGAMLGILAAIGPPAATDRQPAEGPLQQATVSA